jgi:hypothetical protein
LNYYIIIIESNREKEKTELKDRTERKEAEREAKIDLYVPLSFSP